MGQCESAAGDEPGLRFVRVPPEMAGAFLDAEREVTDYFARRQDAPERGTLEVAGERYILVRAASMAVRFHDLVEDVES